MKRIRGPASFGISFVFLWRILPLLLMAGCAGISPQPQPPPPPQVQLPSRPPPLPAPPAPPQPAPPLQAHARHYPDFVALIVQPGDTFLSLASQYLGDPSLDWFLAEFNGSAVLRPGQPLIIPLTFREKGGLSRQGYQTVPVLTYHKFSPNRADAMTVTAKAFGEQMQFLKEKGYRVITLDAFFAFLDFKAPIPPKSVVITIDDGWRSVYDIAFPILKKYGYPATLFVYTDLISPSEKTLDWGLIRAMARGGIDIQCHTKTHRKLEKGVKESWQEFFASVKKELTESAQVIKRRLNKDVKYLAYPYGDTNPFVSAMAGKLGYRGAFTVERESNPFFIHPYRVHRAMIYGHFDLQDFEKNLTSFREKALR